MRWQIWELSPALYSRFGKNRTLETNKRIQAVDDGKTVFYLDIYHAFVGSDGRFLPGATLDGTHLSEKGYQIWADAMRPALQKLLQK